LRVGLAAETLDDQAQILFPRRCVGLGKAAGFACSAEFGWLQGQLAIDRVAQERAVVFTGGLVQRFRQVVPLREVFVVARQFIAQQPWPGVAGETDRPAPLGDQQSAGGPQRPADAQEISEAGVVGGEVADHQRGLQQLRVERASGIIGAAHFVHPHAVHF
jgi:hypothetical protein